MNDKFLGAIYGALIGDACGCPYEFNSPTAIPPFNQIDMSPPDGFKRTYSKIPIGTYTDDGAQLLCLLETLIENNELIPTLTKKLRNWLFNGYMAVDQITFDVGSQTRAALQYTGDVVEALNNPDYNGNGSLMRCIPSAIMATDLDNAISIAMTQSLATHPHVRSRLCCGLYAGIAYKMLIDNEDADIATTTVLAKLLKQFPDERVEIGLIHNHKYNEPTGLGYVVDALWSALYALRCGKDYESVIKYAIELGNDTDTTACIAGGLAGIKFGMQGIPQRWMEALRGKELISSLVKRALDKRTTMMFDFAKQCCFCGANNEHEPHGYAGERSCANCGKGGGGEPDEKIMAYKMKPSVI